MRCDGIGFLFLLQNKKNMYDEINFLNFKLYLFRVESIQCNYDKDLGKIFFNGIDDYGI